ncbi:keratin, type I cytoskeletal 10-like [Cucumis melo var. makuwa]|uniref:Keratin, type I cytoskeletal 10-like n=1 Tax=Cucumis melo var. makuwa TaxID=1194695 RepID=A0A5A7TDE3_CUCMM|nr:keratin, type I cytoskeletal 10-like [Cucumis melo var. makuwa]TYJ95545.1 keratin, type I cytoskeletal 10-like [Cucumis melo var. makuwa]
MKTYKEQTVRLRGKDNNTNGQLLLTHVEWKARQKLNNGDNFSVNNGHRSYGSDHERWQGQRRGRSHGRGVEHQNSMGGTRNTRKGTRDKSHIKCFTCNKMGHYTSKCHGKIHDDEAHLTCTVEEERTLMMVVF